MTDFLKKIKIFRRPLDLVFLIAGTFIGSVAINAILIPSNILSGGVTGIAILVSILTDVNSSLIILALNIPIFIFGYKHMRRRFILSSALGMLLLSLFLTLTSGISFGELDVLTTVLLGGVINGIGFGLVFRANSSCGGSDIISKVVNKYFSYSIPMINLAFNVIVVALSIYFFDINTAVKTIATMYVSTLVIKFMLEGAAYKRTVFIVSDKKENIIKDVALKLGRGSTIINGEGGYTGRSHNMLYVVVSIHQLSRLKEIIRCHDETAFINIVESKAVIGNGKGFYGINEDVEEDGNKTTADIKKV